MKEMSVGEDDAGKPSACEDTEEEDCYPGLVQCRLQLLQRSPLFLYRERGQYRIQNGDQQLWTNKNMRQFWVAHEI